MYAINVRHVNRGQRKVCFTSRHVSVKKPRYREKRARTIEHQTELVARINQNAFDARGVIRELRGAL